MDILKIDGATRTIGESQAYIGLPLRDEIIECEVGGQLFNHHSMSSEWLPTPAELLALQAGASIILRVMGASHPPVSVMVRGCE